MNTVCVQNRLAIAIGVICLLASVVSAYLFRQHEVVHEIERHNDLSKRVYRTIVDKVDDHIEILEALGAFLDHNPDVTQNQFETLSGKLIGDQKTIQALEWVPRVLHAKRANVEQVARFSGFQGFRFTEQDDDGNLVPASDRAEYFPVFLVAPIAQNSAAVGFDLSSNAARRAALEHSRDTGRTSFSQAVTLVQGEESQPGFLAFRPVYRRDLPQSTIEERRESLIGFALGAFKISDIIASAIPETGMEVDFRLIDQEADGPEKTLYSTLGPEADTFGNGAGVPMFSKEISSYPRKWHFEAIPLTSSTLRSGHVVSIPVLASGLLASLLIAACVVVINNRRLFAERLVDEKTRELSERNTELLFRQHVLDEHAIVSVADIRGNIIFSNDKFCEISGFSREELIGNNHRIVKSNEHPVEMYVDMWETISSGKTWRGEIKNKRKNGGFYWVDATIVPRINEKGIPYQYVAVRTDITKNKENEARFRSLTAVSPAGIFETDHHGMITYVNDKWCEIAGMDSSQAMGYGWLNSIHKDDRGDCRDSWERYIKEQAEFRREQRYVKPNGDVTHCFEQATPIHDQNGVVTGHVGVVLDITEQKDIQQSLLETQAELERSLLEVGESRERIEAEAAKQIEMAEELSIAKDEAEAATHAKSEFLASMSHEIRTPMTGVMGFADLLLEGKLDLDSRDKVYKIKDATRSLLRIINDILDMSKMEAGKMEIEFIDFHMPSMLDDVVGLFSEKRKGERAKNVELTVELRDDFPVGVNGDSTRVRQVLVNLIGNAMKFTEEGSVTIEGSYQSEDEKEFYKIAIRDTGIGMKPEVMDSLFMEFTQAEASITRRFEGTGLGLSICKRLVDIMGGDIGAESEYGQGSTFWFKLPYIPATTEVSGDAGGFAKAINSYKAKVPLHILIVDDNKLNQQIIFATIIGFGHTAKVVEDGMEAVEVYGSGNFDLILMDIRMPVMSGPEATRVIRGMSNGKADVPIIALTADAMAEHKKGYYEAGMNEVVTKPIDRTELASTINTVMGQEIHIPDLTASNDDNVDEADGAPSEDEVKASVDDFLKQIGASMPETEVPNG